MKNFSINSQYIEAALKEHGYVAHKDGIFDKGWVRKVGRHRFHALMIGGHFDNLLK